MSRFGSQSTGAIALAAVLALSLSGCGASKSDHGSTSNLPTTSTAAATTATTAAVPPRTTGQVSGKRAKRAASSHQKTTTKSSTPAATSHQPVTPTHHTAAASDSGVAQPNAHHRSRASPRRAATNPPVAALPNPVVSGAAGGMRSSLHGANHAPKVNRLWHYSVQATTAARQPLSGTVESEFVFGGQVVGRESPPTHHLTDGRLDDSVTFPAQAVGIPLTFRVVVRTNLGLVTLDWPVKVTR
jgi:hypothetical protein